MAPDLQMKATAPIIEPCRVASIIAYRHCWNEAALVATTSNLEVPKQQDRCQRRIACVYRKPKLERSGDGVRQGWRVN